MSTPTLRKLLLGILGACALFPAAVSANVLETLAVREIGSATEILCGFSEASTWHLSFPSPQVIEIVLEDTAAAPAVSDLELPDSLVARAEVSSQTADGIPTTTLTVHTRIDVTPSVRASETQLTLILAAGARIGPSAQSTAAQHLLDADAEDEQAVQSTSDYRIGLGDVLRISVFGSDELDQKVRVLPDGSATFPLLGSVSLGGLSLEAAEHEIEGHLRARNLLRDPQVTIFVEEYVSRAVTIQGAVTKPGSYQMIETKSLLEMLGQAGGLVGRDTERAGQKIIVVRKTEDGTEARFEIDAIRLLGEGDPAVNMPLEPGDVVLVPHSVRLRVYVTGEVEKPGDIDYFSSEGITVLQAITAAGGPTDRTNQQKVFILRRLADGNQQRLPVNVRKIELGEADDVLLRNNDTVVVKASFF
jgi:polysaccharide export outer membrane protein